MNKNGCYIDLHAHLDGSVTVDIAKKLAALQNIALPTDNDEELLTLLSVPDSCAPSTLTVLETSGVSVEDV